MKYSVIAWCLFLIMVSCKRIQKISDAITNPTSRTIFERDFIANDSLFQIYNSEYLSAKRNNLQLELPSIVHLKSQTIGFKILGYTVDLKRGERFKIVSDMNADSLQLAIDLFEFENDSVLLEKPMAANKPRSNGLIYDVIKTGSYKVIIVPYRTNSSDLSLKLVTEPSLLFPVSGKGNKDIQSFWGVERDGGSRSHEGIDVFATRGAPVVAATDGVISNTGNRGLGGKQVWLRDGIFGQSLYYAHLDSIKVSSGERVKIGDTLGFVGNTGNAKTTNPHLHFGIYTSGGAIDPLPFVKLTPQIETVNILLFSKGETQLPKNELRLGADAKNKKLQNIAYQTPVEILGKTKRWFHVRIHDSLQGFMHETLIKEIE